MHICYTIWFSVYNYRKYMLENTEGAIKNLHSREMAAYVTQDENN
jgi:hypothetical protein